MTRAYACAIETEVTSLLIDYSFDANGTWMLPKAETLCMLRYHHLGLQEAGSEGQVTMEMDSKTNEREDQRKGKSAPMPQNFRHPDLLYWSELLTLV
ncbi:hypothetical protein D1007_36157 [Hordeum vulgare]|nr:hypothetical protein D1007_36157 [Hordeum vulgare]